MLQQMIYLNRKRSKRKCHKQHHDVFLQENYDNVGGSKNHNGGVEWILFSPSNHPTRNAAKAKRKQENKQEHRVLVK